MKTMIIALAAAFVLAIAGASAQTPAATTSAAPPATCQAQLDDLSRTLSRLMPFGLEKPAQGKVMGHNGHTHTGIDYNYMNTQMRRAQQDCKAGKPHEAMLRMDVVRAVMRLPEVGHPASHNDDPSKG
jgi:hypothetical protein